MGKQMEETRKGFMEGDFGGDRLDLLVTAELLDEAGIDPVDEIEIPFFLECIFQSTASLPV